MKNVKNIIFILLFSLSYILSPALCAEEKRIAVSKAEKARLISVLDLNDELHMAFFEYDPKQVEEKAKALLQALKKIENNSLKKILRPAISSLKEMTADKKRPANNESYAKASLSLVYIVNRYDVGPGYNEYTCPMVKKKWVQNSSKRARTHNPYASEMPHCGGQVTDY